MTVQRPFPPPAVRLPTDKLLFVFAAIALVSFLAPLQIIAPCSADDGDVATANADTTASQDVSDSADSDSVDSSLDPQYWAEQLGHDRFLRRESATRELIQLGDAAVDPLVAVIDNGNLEVNQRAISILSAIALQQSPKEDDGAYGALLTLSDTSAGSRLSMVQRALAEIAATRREQAESILRDAGYFIGADHFSFSLSTLIIPVKMLRVDGSWKDEPDTVTWLRWLTDIQYAEIRGDAVCTDVIKQLAKMPSLQYLAIIDGDLDAEAISEMKSMAQLKELELRYVSLDDEKRELLSSVPIRLTLSIMGTGTSEEQADQMRRDLPGLAIIHHNGGFLGVNCSTRSEACIIDAIVRESAAEAAGLRPGDMIIGIDQTEVEQFSDLQQAVKQRKAGDEIEVRYRRLNLGEVATVKATLRKYRSR
ncbi:PDZ domain-containing protein [Stieleria varia]|uniref:PDZ domain (Also known as DHR or GLGF) n=1 Tax=Stieleria varia TaxID=2528005 RepID=A0A5C6A3C1_9BACT|nr:PDZ domain-containing protein [Stieleria varia]TWT94402.1 PDZ domain (Also known as DHR or GLGF) [Stieleria varia]